ncbi:MAG: acetoacetate--CoA ligase [Hyphomicrobiaceae bacterium]|nr:acetoacetate--CoA ligase [Hyphomicrobiaceae bacterium]
MPKNTTSTLLWTPSPQRIANANITAFLDAAKRDWGVKLDSYADLHNWSIRHPSQFWTSLWDFLEIISDGRGDVVLEHQDSIKNARFFPEATLSFAENLLRRRDESLSVIFWNENGTRRYVTAGELYDQVSRIAQALKHLGVDEGDRVAAILPNIPDTLACMLATNALGAIWTSCSPDFGAQGAIDRIGQIDPKVLFVSDGYYYNGALYDTRERLPLLRRHMPSLDNIIVVPYLGLEAPRNKDSILLNLPDLTGKFQPADIRFVRRPFDQPAFILYTSGTTGAPKCFVHSAGGTLIQLLKEHILHFDVKPRDRFFYYTTTGWNMWYTLVSVLGAGGTVCIYEGAAFCPRAEALFDFAAAEAISVLGASPAYFDRLKKLGVAPADTHDLRSLRTILSTGAPLGTDTFDYVYRHIKSDVQLSSISGGTEIMTTFANGNPIGPVWRGELQVRTLGMDVRVVDEQGDSIRSKRGELICAAPFPSRPLRLWNDPDGSRYHETYFSRFPNVWTHGDFAELTDHDGMVIHGRSDTVLNRNGVRIGTAEIYRPVEALPEIADTILVDRDWAADDRMVLFVQLAEGATLDDALIEKIRRQIREHASPRHVPDRIIQVPAIPYTVNGKKVELAIKALLQGRAVKNLGSIANPDALKAFETLKF